MLVYKKKKITLTGATKITQKQSIFKEVWETIPEKKQCQCRSNSRVILSGRMSTEDGYAMHENMCVQDLHAHNQSY